MENLTEEEKAENVKDHYTDGYNMNPVCRFYGHISSEKEPFVNEDASWRHGYGYDPYRLYRFCSRCGEKYAC